MPRLAGLLNKYAVGEWLAVGVSATGESLGVGVSATPGLGDGAALLSLPPAGSLCDRPWLRRYAKLHGDIMAGRHGEAATRFLLVRPHERAGLGNRLRAVFGALAVAVRGPMENAALELPIDKGRRCGQEEGTEGGGDGPQCQGRRPPRLRCL